MAWQRAMCLDSQRRCYTPSVAESATHPATHGAGSVLPGELVTQLCAWPTAAVPAVVCLLVCVLADVRKLRFESVVATTPGTAKSTMPLLTEIGRANPVLLRLVHPRAVPCHCHSSPGGSGKEPKGAVLAGLQGPVAPRMVTPGGATTPCCNQGYSNKGGRVERSSCSPCYITARLLGHTPLPCSLAAACCCWLPCTLCCCCCCRRHTPPTPGTITMASTTLSAKAQPVQAPDGLQWRPCCGFPTTSIAAA